MHASVFRMAFKQVPSRKDMPAYLRQMVERNEKLN
jgi:hypothetical protein